MQRGQRFSENQIISSRQVAWILTLNILAAGLFWLPALVRGYSYTDMLCQGAAALVLVLLYYGGAFLLMNRSGDKNLHEQNSNGVRLAIRVFFLVYYLAAAVYAVQFFYRVIDALIVENYAYPVPILFLLIAAVYGAGKGIEVRGRTAELLGWLVCVPFLIFFAVGVWQTFENGWPEITEVTWGKVLPGGYAGALFFLLGDHPALLYKYMRSGKGHKQVLWYGLAGSCLMVMAALVLTGAFLTPAGMAREAQPFGILLQIIRFPGNFISRYDVFFIMLWMLSFYIFASGMVLHAVEMLAEMTKVEQHKGRKRQMALGLGLVILGLACLARQWPAFDQTFQYWMLWIGMPVSVLLVLISGQKKQESGG